MSGARVFVVEPVRVRARLDRITREERELTDVVAATWRASEDVPLLHLTYERVSRGESTSASTRAAHGARVHSHSPPVVQGDAARIAAHVRGWPRTVAG